MTIGTFIEEITAMREKLVMLEAENTILKTISEPRLGNAVPQEVRIFGHTLPEVNYALSVVDHLDMLAKKRPL